MSSELKTHKSGLADAGTRRVPRSIANSAVVAQPFPLVRPVYWTVTDPNRAAACVDPLSPSTSSSPRIRRGCKRACPHSPRSSRDSEQL